MTIAAESDTRGRDRARRDAPHPAPAQSFSLYLHLPYCEAKCPYCDFNSYAATSWPEERYAAALASEMRMYATQAPWKGAEVATIFFGGGTPSLFRPATIGAMLDAVAARWSLAHDVEITLEANPGTVERGRLAEFRAAGVNRLSFGIQSFHDALLVTLGRIHDADDSRAAIAAARAAGFENLNLDLIFAVPGQTRAMWEADVGEALRHAPEHVSAYNLTYEPGTPFHTRRARGQLAPLDETEELWMYQHVRERLAACGYLHYEISNFCRPGHPAHHNLAYWRGTDYLGLGAGAHSYASTPEWGRRWSNERLPERYMAAAMAAADGTYGATAGANGAPDAAPDAGAGAAVEAPPSAVASSEELTFAAAAAEFMFLGMRELDGVDPSVFRKRFNRELASVHPEVDRLRAEGWLVERDGRLALSERGLLLADSIFATFL